jgi:AP2-associated kinase
VLDLGRTKSHTLGIPKSPASSRPSLETQRPTAAELADPINRSRSANSRPRPVSAYLDSKADYTREPENYDKPLPPRPEPRKSSSAVESSDDEGPEKIGSNLGFLKDMEAEKHSRRRSSGKSHHHRKNIPSISLSGTKNIITGRFSDAFKKFEGGGSGGHKHHEEDSHSHHRHESSHHEDALRPRVLTPIAGSVATGASDDIAPLEEIEDLPPEVRRELERQQLEQEERRVAAAAAAYKNKVADPRDRGLAQQKGSAIQNRVKELLDVAKEGGVQVTRTAEGYGRFTEGVAGPGEGQKPPVARKPVGIVGTRPAGAAVANATGPRPMVAPKPKTLRTGSGQTVASSPNPANPPAAANASMTPVDDDWEVNFQKRYPSLQGLEMVETEVRPAMRVKDV